MERLDNWQQGLNSFLYKLSPATKDFLAGQPLDVVRIRLQQKTATTRSMTQVWKTLVQKEGARSLFKGAMYPVTTIAMQNSMVFYSYGAAARWLSARREDMGKPLPLSHVYMAGCFSGLCQTVITIPTELLKIRLQLQTATPGMPGYVGPIRLLRQVLYREGLTGLYRGTGVTLIRDFPSFGVYFAAYEGMQELLEPGCRQSGENSPTALFLAGGTAGAVAWASVYPLDMIKSRLQATSRAASEYSGWWDCAKIAYREEGGRVFFNGMTATLTRAFIVNAAVFSVYEFLVRLMEEHHEVEHRPMI
eukprot:jgi/Astpho2/4551/Aster-00134